MREHYIVKTVFEKNEYYMIWYSDETDSFVTKSSAVIFFDNFEDTVSYAKKHGLCIITSDISLYDFDILRDWLKEPKYNFDSEFFLDFWNIFDDMSKSVSREFLGNFSKNTDIYNKLFYGSNLPAIRGNGEEYIPVWNNEEIQRLEKIMNDGMSIFNFIIGV